MVAGKAHTIIDSKEAALDAVLHRASRPKRLEAADHGVLVLHVRPGACPSRTPPFSKVKAWHDSWLLTQSGTPRVLIPMNMP